MRARLRPPPLPDDERTPVRAVIAARAMRGFADGLVSVVLATYLDDLGFSPLEIGAVVTGTLIGSAALTLFVSLGAHRLHVRTLLLIASGLMAATGIGFAAVTAFWPLLAVAVIGTLNPSGGDVSVFLPTEQAYIADRVSDAGRPHTYAVYNFGGSLAAAIGALLSALADSRGERRATFLLYVVVAGALAAIYYRMPRQLEVGEERPRRGLGASRRTVLQLSALFSLDSAGGGFVVQSLLVLWLHLRFALSPATTAGLFFGASLLSGASQLAAGPLSRRIGLIRTMVFTHLPANAFLILAAFAPRSSTAIALLLLRALLSQMDVPARQAFVMSAVTPEERAAAAGVTNVPRSLASAATPLAAGALLSATSFGWPLVIGGTAKIVYDLALLWLYGRSERVIAA